METSEENYNNLTETLYINSISRLKDEIIKRANASEDDFVDENMVDWN
mgnify:CR=1 FL=1